MDKSQRLDVILIDDNRNSTQEELLATAKQIALHESVAHAWVVEDVRFQSGPELLDGFRRYRFEVYGVCSEGLPSERFGKDPVPSASSKTAASPDVNP